MEKSQINFKDYRILYDGQKEGYNASGGSAIYTGGTIQLIFQESSDGEKGLRPLFTQSSDLGKNWSQPKPFGPDILKDPAKEFMALGLLGPSKKETLFSIGFHLEKGIDSYDGIKWRPSTEIIGRKEIDDRNFTYQYFKPVTFLGEQFIGGGSILSNGRILLTIWGAKNQNENWRCGVLISDDDGLSWEYREVGYEPDLSIRNRVEIPAGYNEQSLFETKDGEIVSLIRGRDKLGIVHDSPKDTWFFRSASQDGGETWAKPEVTDIAGAGAAGSGITLPDGSLLHACRIPYHRTMYSLPVADAYGIHMARSFDMGKTWETVLIKQQSPEGRVFKIYHSAMNGRFILIKQNRWIYVFGQYDNYENIHRILALEFEIV